MMYVRFPLSLRNVEDLLAERGIDICHETVRHWWNRFGALFATDVRRQRVSRMRGFRQWKWHLDEVYVKVGGELHYLWRAVDQEGEVLESYVTKTRDKAAAVRFMKKALRRHGLPEAITTDGLRSYKAAMDQLGNAEKQEIGRWANNRVENSNLPFRRRERAMLIEQPLLLFGRLLPVIVCQAIIPAIISGFWIHFETAVREELAEAPR
jgi:putative transposase